jgi:hypothetical protein
MTFLTTILMSVLHPGDLGLEGWLMLLALFFFLIVVPIFLVGFIIYKVATRR